MPNINLGPDSLTRIKVVGVGGAGGNAVNRMIEVGLQGVEFVAVNTDAQALGQSNADRVVQIGVEGGEGLGAGHDPKVGAQAAMDHQDEIREALEGAKMVFVTAGEGGGTGTGAAPVIAKIARDELGALTVAVVHKPFSDDLVQTCNQAEEGIDLLSQAVDVLVVIPNDRLIDPSDKKLTQKMLYALGDEALRNAVQGIVEIITTTGLVNVDFNDVRTVMTGAGTALMGFGEATGENRAVEALEQALDCELFESTMDGATRVLYNIAGGDDLLASEISYVRQTIASRVDPTALVIRGENYDEAFTDTIRVTVIATGFPVENKYDDPKNLFASTKQETVAAKPMAAPEAVKRTTVDVTDENFLPDFMKQRR